MARIRVPGRASAVATAAVLCLTASACGNKDATGGEADPGNADEPKKIAFLTASSANTWLAEAKKSIEEIAAANNAEVTEFDAQFKPAEQTKQIQDVIASGQYDGIIITAIDGSGVIPDLEVAIEEGIDVAILNQVVGPELDTADPQVPGVAVSVLAPPLKSGERLGELTKQACADVDPCNVVYFFGIKGLPIDTAVREGFDQVTSSETHIEVVAEGEGQYLGPEESMKSMQDILQKTTDIDVVVGADQSIQGSLLALEDAALAEDVKLIGFGGSKVAIEGIEFGAWFGDVFGAPKTEAELATEALIEAMNNGTETGGIDPASELPDEGLVTAENVSEFEPQWAG